MAVIKKKKKPWRYLWDLESFVIGRHNFGEPLDVFMEKPVRDETPQYMTTERHILSKPTMQLLS